MKHSTEPADTVSFTVVQEITDLLNRYAWAVDTRDWEAYAACFTADAVLSMHPAGLVMMKDELLATIQSWAATLAGTRHLISNHVITVSGETARSKCYVQAHHWGKPDLREGQDQPWVVTGYYEDELAYVDQTWLIRERDLTYVHESRSWAEVAG
jgi:3-phenylpropionate/cinnamic acid dioxygenase small subunit